MRRHPIIHLICGQLFLVSLCLSLTNAEKPNVLIIGIDDLRPELNCYGAEHIHSPNIDRLAERGALFTRAYCQYAICGPSRSSLFSGLRPDTIQAYNNKTHFRDTRPDTVSLPEHFKNHGYATYGFGKVLHNTHRDDPSWSQPQHYILEKQYASLGLEQMKAGIDGVHASNKQLPLFERPDVDDDAYRDGVTNRAAIRTLRTAARSDQPFLLFMGYHKPHTPFNAPKRYWDLYDPKTLPLADNPFAPRGSPEFAVSPWRYVRSFQGMPEEGPLPEPLARQVRHAYFACISYIDALIGNLLSALDDTGKADNTVIALFSDHGYQLGEHGMWCKHSNFETSTHIPFLIIDPRSESKGITVDQPVELIDLYPTLADIADIPSAKDLDGKSLADLVRSPNRSKIGDTVAYSQYHRAGNRGLSVRSQRFRYTEWRDTKSGEIVAQELYDHRNDPQENINVAYSRERAASLKIIQHKLYDLWPPEELSQ